MLGITGEGCSDCAPELRLILQCLRGVDVSAILVIIYRSRQECLLCIEHCVPARRYLDGIPRLFGGFVSFLVMALALMPPLLLSAVGKCQGCKLSPGVTS